MTSAMMNSEDLARENAVTNKIATLALAGSFLLSSTAAMAAEKASLPRNMIWTAYDLGSSGYAEASGVANALMKSNDVRIRIVPSGTSIGRLLPLTTGKADFGFLSNEVFFATEATYDFAVQSWGPQDLRVLMGPPSANGMITAADAGIKQASDFKGKLVGYVKGNPSVNVKADAALAFGGLKRSDVQPVWFGSYSALKSGLLGGQIDAYSGNPTAANAREVEASTRGLAWPEFPPENAEGWARLQKLVGFMSPMKVTSGAGISADNAKDLLGYRYPMITTYGRTSEDLAYALVKAVDESFDSIRDATALGAAWKLETAGLPPADAPWHPGTISYLKEKSLWTPEAQAWNEARLARLEQVQTAWDNAMTEFNEMRAEKAQKGTKIDPDEAWPEFWEDYRQEHLD